VTHHAVAQILCIIFLQAQPVVLAVPVPLLEVDLQVDGLAVADAADAEQGLDIDDPDAAQLDEVLGDRRRCADEGHLTHTPDLDDIVRHQPVAALDQLQGSLGLADATVAGQQEPDAVNIDQDAVHGNAGGQLDIEPAQHLRHEGARRLRGHVHGLVVPAGDLQDMIVRRKSSREDDHGDFLGKELVENLLLVLLRHLLNVGILTQTDDLDPAGREMIKIAGQLQGGPVDLRLPDLDVRRPYFRGQGGQVHFLNNFFNSQKSHR